MPTYATGEEAQLEDRVKYADGSYPEMVGEVVGLAPTSDELDIEVDWKDETGDSTGVFPEAAANLNRVYTEHGAMKKKAGMWQKIDGGGVTFDDRVKFKNPNTGREFIGRVYDIDENNIYYVEGENNDEYVGKLGPIARGFIEASLKTANGDFNVGDEVIVDGVLVRITDTGFDGEEMSGWTVNPTEDYERKQVNFNKSQIAEASLKTANTGIAVEFNGLTYQVDEVTDEDPEVGIFGVTFALEKDYYSDAGEFGDSVRVYDENGDTVGTGKVVQASKKKADSRFNDGEGVESPGKGNEQTTQTTAPQLPAIMGSSKFEVGDFVTINDNTGDMTGHTGKIVKIDNADGIDNYSVEYEGGGADWYGDDELTAAELSQEASSDEIQEGDEVEIKPEYGGGKGTVVGTNGSYLMVETKSGIESINSADVTKIASLKKKAEYVPKPNERVIVKGTDGEHEGTIWGDGKIVENPHNGNREVAVWGYPENDSIHYEELANIRSASLKKKAASIGDTIVDHDGKEGEVVDTYENGNLLVKGVDNNGEEVEYTVWKDDIASVKTAGTDNEDNEGKSEVDEILSEDVIGSVDSFGKEAVDYAGETPDISEQDEADNEDDSENDDEAVLAEMEEMAGGPGSGRRPGGGKGKSEPKGKEKSYTDREKGTKPRKKENVFPPSEHGDKGLVNRYKGTDFKVDPREIKSGDTLTFNGEPFTTDMKYPRHQWGSIAWDFKNENGKELSVVTEGRDMWVFDTEEADSMKNVVVDKAKTASVKAAGIRKKAEFNIGDGVVEKDMVSYDLMDISKIVKVNPDGTFDIEDRNGGIYNNVSEDKIKKASQKKTASVNESTPIGTRVVFRDPNGIGDSSSLGEGYGEAEVVGFDEKFDETRAILKTKDSAIDFPIPVRKLSLASLKKTAGFSVGDRVKAYPMGRMEREGTVVKLDPIGGVWVNWDDMEDIDREFIEDPGILSTASLKRKADDTDTLSWIDLPDWVQEALKSNSYNESVWEAASQQERNQMLDETTNV